MRDRSVRRAIGALRRTGGIDEGRLRDPGRGRLRPRDGLFRVRARGEADRRPHLRGRHRHHELLGLQHRRIRRIRLRPARGQRGDPRRDEEDPRRHPVRQVRQGLDAGEPRQPDLVQGHARQDGGASDRADRGKAAHHEAVDQAARAGRPQPQLSRCGARSLRPAAMAPPAVALAEVTVTFRLADGGAYPAVEDASLSVADGEFVAIVGPTGCGKSTLLNIAAGLIAPSSGRIDIFGVPLASLNRQAGYLFQAEALFPWKTALENVAIGLETAGVARAAARERAQAWLARVGLSEFGARYPHMLSGGQRKRVGLVQVLIRAPTILLMDEPFGPLDAQTRQIMGNLLLDLWSADRKAVLFVTHDLEEAIALSDRVVIMSAGPAARVIGDWKVALPRPRDIAEIKIERAFHDLHREIWATLKSEVLKGYAQTGGG